MTNKASKSHSDFILFKTEDQKVSVDVRFEDETVWLTQDQIAVLFDKGRSTIAERLCDYELQEKQLTLSL